MRLRVHELAREWGIEIKDLILRLERLGVYNRRAQSLLTEEEIERLRPALAIEQKPPIPVGSERVVVSARAQTVVERRVRTNVIRRRTTRIEPRPTIAIPVPVPAEPVVLTTETFETFPPPEPLPEPVVLEHPKPREVEPPAPLEMHPPEPLEIKREKPEAPPRSTAGEAIPVQSKADALGTIDPVAEPIVKDAEYGLGELKASARSSRTRRPWQESGRLVEKIRAEFDRRFPFALLSHIPLYRNDRPETELLANEIDHLFHCRDTGGGDRLVIVEVKQQKIYGGNSGEAPTAESPWRVEYPVDATGATWREKDVTHQVRHQARALRQFCQPLRSSALIIESWVVDARDDEPAVIVDARDRRFQLLTYRGFLQKLDSLRDVVSVEHSVYLRMLRLGLPAPGLGHPEIPNAIRYIEHCRQNLDREIVRLFQPKPRYYAINGCAGMGKSMLLAYGTLVFASDRTIESDGHGRLANFREQAASIALPAGADRRIYVYAASKKQVEVLREHHWESVKRLFGEVSGGWQPALQSPHFRKWTGEIPSDCNVLVIDEAHDLSQEHQHKIASWISARDGRKKYLLVGCDRNQGLRRGDADTEIITGMSFVGHSTRLNRIYRCPFPVYAASIGLLFRWFAPGGAKVVLSSEKLREQFGFRPHVAVEEEQTVLAMRNDSHPGNNWQQTVKAFYHPELLYQYLSELSLRDEDVLWVRYRKTDPEFDYSQVGAVVDLGGDDADEEVDQHVKGQEFPVVVVEGLPRAMNPEGLVGLSQWGTEPEREEQAMWRSRRNLHVACTRATAFLFFLFDPASCAETDRLEMDELIRQLSRPVRREHESGLTWTIAIGHPATTRRPRIFLDIVGE